MRKPFVIGHRGCPTRAPENTLEGIREAFKAGVDLVEIDVRACKDGLVVIHDPELSRLAGKNLLVRECNLDDLRRVRVRGAKIPTLSEALELIKELGIGVVLDVKDEGIEEDLMGELKSYNLVDRVYIISFKHDIIRRVKEYEPRVRAGIIMVSKPIKLIEVIKVAKADAVFMPGFLWGVETLSKEVVNEVHRGGFEIVGDPVNDKHTLKRALELGLDGIGTDRAYEIVKTLRDIGLR